MKNNNGKSPLDIAIDNESPKNTELLLRKLTLFKSASLSMLFYDRFSELLSMNITAFHEYLDSCFFQTIQMREIKYLKLKDESDPLLVPHSSCLIDDVFIEKYCKLSENKELVEAKQRKDEEERLKAELDKQEEQKQQVQEQENNEDASAIKESIISGGKLKTFKFRYR